MRRPTTYRSDTAVDAPGLPSGEFCATLAHELEMVLHQNNQSYAYDHRGSRFRVIVSVQLVHSPEQP